MTHQEEAPRLIYVADVAKMLNRTPAAVRWLIQNGSGPRSTFMAGRRVFQRAEVEAWIDAQFEKEAS